MKKAILIVLTLALGACSPKIKTSEKKPLYEVLTEQGDGGANIQFFEILSEANEIAMLQNDDKLKHKVKSDDVQNSNFIILNMGEKPTGGYTIGVENVVETDKSIIITVKKTEPELNAMVTQGTTTPYCIVKINSKKEIIVN